MKKILFLAVFALTSAFCFTGCSTDGTCSFCNTSQSIEKKYKAFNDEVYVWEDFNFTTNKVERD